MEAWARRQLEELAGSRDLSIRAGDAFVTLRRQPCFALASDFQIRSAIWKHATRVNCSIVCREADDHRMMRWAADAAGFYLGPRPDPPPKPKPLSQGIIWRRLCKEWAARGLPIPAHPWPIFRPKLLTEMRVGRAGLELPFCCPLCSAEFYSRKYTPEAHAFGHWCVQPQLLFCADCSDLQRARSRAHVTRRHYEELAHLRRDVRGASKIIRNIEEKMKCTPAI